MRRTFRCCRRICQAGKPDLRPTRFSAVLTEAPGEVAVRSSRCAGLEGWVRWVRIFRIHAHWPAFSRPLGSELLFTAKLSKNEPTSSATDVKALPFGNTHPPRPSRVALMCRVVRPAHELEALEHN
jgi:hypothetical protein